LHIGCGAGGRQLAAGRCHHGRIAVGDRRVDVVVHRQRVVTGEHGDGVEVAIKAVELVGYAPVADLLIEVGAKYSGFEATAIAEVLGQGLAGAASMVKLRISPLIRVPVSGLKPGIR
jgi:hypothetical protein